MEQPSVRADILGKLLLIQQVLDVLPDNGEIAAFLRRALGEIPGVIEVHVCVQGAVFPPSDEFNEACAKCEVLWSASGNGTECMVRNASTIRAPLRTARRVYGVLILSLGDEGVFSPYQSFVQNIANVVATTLETRQYIRQLNDARAGLEDQVAERTTRLRESDEELATGLRIRAAVAESLIGVRPGQGVPEVAQAICDNVATVPQLDVATLVHFLAEDSAIVTAVHAPSAFPLHAGQALPPGRSRFLYQRAKRGPWAAHWKARAENGEYGRAIAASGLKAVAHGPILYQGTPVGLLTIGTMHEEFAQDVVTRAPGLAEFSATSSALLAGPFDALRRRERERADLQQIIATGAFGPVFQSIQDLASGEVVGYEALTRFTDGRRPDHRFESAWSVGLGIELELATLESAVAAAAGLPAGRWLDINVSPRLLQTPERLTEIVRRVDRPLVIEITEHDVIEDYPAIRDAVRVLGPNTRLAVDDAGAGIANFGHIVELRPDFVKLDIGLVRGVNTDLGRQALVIAMRHFSRTSGCRLVAEGVETKAEADTLAQLGVHFGQGYWFGRPQSVDAFVSAQPESSAEARWRTDERESRPAAASPLRVQLELLRRLDDPPEIVDPLLAVLALH
ncbi:MAG: EAL domain-containing protein [Candidatus Limnocylindrales bacterium]|jgi:EAL domain-containing protein (putative c-di-GMP-specific phosphodiesterase class I)